MKSNKNIILLLLLSIGSITYGQNSINVSGTVIDGIRNQPVEFATVMAKEIGTEKLITGATTATDGSFSFNVKSESFFIEITFVGYKPLQVKDFSINNNKVNLGKVKLATDVTQIDEVTVRAEKSMTEFKLDKRIFNVGKDLTSTGASALDVLNNVPSVNVNIEGEISLRGSTGVQILINGKPSVLTSEDGGNALGTITANMIEKIEVMTNPSAKYDAEGTSGIINIVIKKEERRGTNGSLSLNTGVPHNHSLGFSLNHRTEKLNLFSQMGVGYRELPNELDNINRDLITGEEIVTQGTEYRNENFYNIILGTDYYINQKNVLTISGNFAYEIEDQPSATEFIRYNEEGIPTSTWNRTEVTEATNPKWQYEANYKKDFDDHKDHDLIISALGSFFGKDLSSDFTDSSVSGINVDSKQQTRTNFSEAENTLKLDYIDPITDEYTVETGAQYVINNVRNDFAVSDLVEGEWVTNPNFNNIFDFDQKVLGIYGTGAYEGEKWGLMLGVRMENTDLRTFLVNTEEENKQNYTNFFPSAHATYNFTKLHSIQGGYSRRIFRPRLWHLNPFFNIRNNFSIRMGNPALQPEYTDSYEITNMFVKDEMSLNFGVYHRFTTEVVERVSFFENNVNTSIPVNIGTNRTTGIEVNTKFNVTNWLTVNGDFNYNYFIREGSLENQVFDFSGDRWTSRINTKWKLPWDIDMEITGNYESAFLTVQSRVSDMLYADFGMRKKILNGKGVLNFSIRDMFASRIGENITEQQNFYLYNRRLRGRFVTLGFSFGFGDGEAMEYSGRRR